MSSYSQTRALWGILRSSLIATRRNISSLVFGLIFPLIFILIFGFLGQGASKVPVVIDKGSDLNNPIYRAITAQDNFDIKTNLDQSAIDSQLKKGQLDGVIKIINDGPPTQPHYIINLITTGAAPQQGSLLRIFMSSFADKANLAASNPGEQVVKFTTSETPGRTFRTIDFILPGMIGFSLLNAGIFATAFVFLTLRQTLVIKRYFTTPISKFSIIFGESLSRLVVSLLQASVIILTGYFAFHFTLVHGWITLIEMLGLSAVGLIIFLGFGLIISSVSKDDRTVAPMAQLVTLPQFLLAGTFFPIDQLPTWLQKVANVLPLTYLNDAMRKVAFEGVGFAAIKTDLLWLVVWGIVVYAVTVRVFRWEAS